MLIVAIQYWGDNDVGMDDPTGVIMIKGSNKDIMESKLLNELDRSYYSYEYLTYDFTSEDVEQRVLKSNSKIDNDFKEVYYKYFDWIDSDDEIFYWFDLADVDYFLGEVLR